MRQQPGEGVRLRGGETDPDPDPQRHRGGHRQNPPAALAPTEHERVESLGLLPPSRRIGHKLHSSATVKEASQTQLCAYLSVALLVGLLANALAGWWWADPVAALVIAAVALREGRDSWKGDSCECC